MWKKVFQYFLRRFQMTQGRSPMTAAEMNQIQSEAVNWINKTGGKTLPGTPQSQKPPFQGFTPRVIEGGKGKAGIGTLLKDSPEAIAKIKADNKAAAERLKAKKKTVEDFKDEGDFDPGGMASGGIAGQLHLYDGGRIGLKDGKKPKFPMSRRTFIGGILSALAYPFIRGFGKQATTKTAAPVVKEVIERGADGIPSYAYDLINVVKAKGTKEIMEGIVKRSPPATRYNYKGVDVIEDGLGNTSVQKQQMKTGQWTDSASDKTIVDDYVDREVGFEIRRGDDIVKDEGLETQKAIRGEDEYNESTAFMQGDPEGGMDVSEVLETISDADHLDLKKIADESLIKKASGGRVDLSKGGLAHVLGV